MGCFRVLLVLLVVPHVCGQTGPAFCTYGDDVFDCDYSSMGSGNRPIDFTGFTVQPQSMTVKVNGFVPFAGDTRTFSDTFANMNKATFDANRPSELTVYCGWAGSVYFSSGAVLNMSYVQHFKVSDCKVFNIPSSAFQDLASLDYFGFERGEIDSVDPNAMNGLTVEKLTTDTHQVPQNLGKFEVWYAKFTSNVIPPGLMYSWKNLTAATFRGAALNSITSDVFQYNTNLRYIDISDNQFTSIPSGLFSGLDRLSDVHLYDIDWACSCDSLWFVEYALNNNITLFGELMCSNQPGTSVRKYWYDSCVTPDVCGTESGITMGKNCQSTPGLLIMVFSIIALIANVGALILTILNRREVTDPEYQKRFSNFDAKKKWQEATRRILYKLKCGKSIDGGNIHDMDNASYGQYGQTSGYNNNDYGHSSGYNNNNYGEAPPYENRPSSGNFLNRKRSSVGVMDGDFPPSARSPVYPINPVQAGLH